MMHIRLATDEDVSPPAGTSSLDGLAEMLGQISSQLDGACDELQRVAARSLRTNGLPAVTSQPSMQMDVRRARSLRGLRKRLLGDQYFTGPPWEILLYLFDFHLRQLRDFVWERQRRDRNSPVHDPSLVGAARSRETHHRSRRPP